MPGPEERLSSLSWKGWRGVGGGSGGWGGEGGPYLTLIGEEIQFLALLSTKL